MNFYRNHFARNWNALFWTLALASLLALVSCDPDGSPENQDLEAGLSPDEIQTLKSPPELVVLTWPDYMSENVLQRFEDETGIHVVCEAIESSDQFAQLLMSRPGIADVVIADDRTLIQLIDLKLVATLDPAKLSRLGNLSPDFLNSDFDPGNEFSVPYLWGTTLLAYRRDHLPTPPKSWKLFWDDQFKGQSAMINEPYDLFHIALLTLGHDPNVAGEKEIGEATESLLRQLGDQGGTISSLEETLDALDSGDVSLVVTYSGDAAARAENNEQIGYVIPDEGAPLWIDSFAICRRSPNISDAHRFIDFMIDAQSAAQSSNDLRHASPNRAAEPFIDEELLRNRALYPPPEVMAHCHFIREKSPNQIRWINRGIKKVYDQLRLRSENLIAPESPFGATANAGSATDDL